MAWRSPRFAFLHAARDAGGSAITSNGDGAGPGSFDADYVREFLIDNRRLPAKVTKAAGDLTIDVNRGAAGLESVDRLVIPTGHNLSGETISLAHDDNAGFTSPTVVVSSVAISSAALIDQEFTGSTERYWRFTVTAPGGTIELPELILTRTRTTTFGPDTEWTDQDRSNVERLPKPSGDRATLETGARQRELELRYNSISGADRTLLRALIDAVGLAEPFLIDPPAEDAASLQADEAVLWVEFERDPRIRGEWLGGVKGDTFRSLEMVEVIG